MTFKRIMALIGGLGLSIVLIACPSANDARPGNDNDNDDDPIVEPSELDPVNIGGIDFASVGTFTGAEIAAIRAQIDTLTPEQLAEFADYVSSWTLTRDTQRSISLTGEEGEEMAEIRGIVGGNIRADLAAGREKAQDARDAANNEPVLAIEREHPTSGDTIRFYVDPSLSSPELIEEISTFVTSLGTPMFNPRVQWISSWTLVPEGDPRLDLNPDELWKGWLGFEQDGAGRIKIFSYSINSGFIGNIANQLIAGQQWAQAQAALGASAELLAGRSH